jgi:hypothetical protein
VPSHQFLHSLLQFYGLELYHLTPLGILHTSAIVTLCEAYIGIEPHFNLWNYLFHVRLQQHSGVEAVTFGNVDIFTKSGRGVDPYFHLSTSNLHHTGSRSVPQPNWGYGVAHRDLQMLQPLRYVVQQLL